MKNNLDQLLQQALSPNEEPDPRLRQNIMQKAKEREHMASRKMRVSLGTAAALMALVFGTLGVSAAVRYLTADKVAEEFSNETLAKAFQTEDAILINESQECAGYRITLLGMVSGEGLSEYSTWDEQGMIQEDKTYVVTAIENLDGTPRPDVSEEGYGEDPFYVSPYIKGLPMADYNAHTLGGGYSEDVLDGIQYRIMECDNVEIFAERGVYLGVSDGSFYNNKAFVMDEITGEISPNQDYDGVNALFELSIPREKGDEAAVAKYLEEMKQEADSSGTGIEQDAGNEEELDPVQKMAATVENWNLSEFEANAQCVYEEELSVDEKGYISYDYDFESGGGSQAKVLVNGLFEENKPGFSECKTIFGGDDLIFIETFELLESGNIMLRVYAYEVE